MQSDPSTACHLRRGQRIMDTKGVARYRSPSLDSYAWNNCSIMGELVSKGMGFLYRLTGSLKTGFNTLVLPPYPSSGLG
jgi:hypothetical protein